MNIPSATTTFIGSGVPLFLFMNICMAAAGVLAARALFPGRPFSFVRLITCVLIAYSGIVASATLCGALGMLDVLPLSICALAILALCASLNIPSVAKLFLLKNTSSGQHTNKTSSTFQTTVAISISIIFALIFTWGILTPPPPWDSFVYHLTFAARWIQEGRIFLVTVPFGDQAGTYFPSNTELYYAWLMLPLRSEIATTAGQAPFLFMLVLLVWRLACKTSSTRNAAAAAAAICAFLPGMMRQATASEVDIIFAFLFVASIYFLITYTDMKNYAPAAILAGLSAGLFTGTKYLGLSFAPLIVLPALYVFISRRKFRHLCAYIIAAIVGGGFWYVRNWIVTGNPVFPLTIGIGGHELFPGGYTSESMKYAVFHAKSAAQWLDAMKATTGLPLGILLAGGNIATLIIFAVKRNIYGLRSIYFATVPILMIAIFAFIVPYNLESRFTYAAWVLSAASFSALLSFPSPAIRYISWAAAAFAFISSAARNDFFLPLLKNFAAMLSGLEIGGAAPPGFLAMLRPGAICFLIFCAAAALTFLFVRTAMTRANRFNALAASVMAIVSAVIFSVALSVSIPRYYLYRTMYHPGFKLGSSWTYLDAYQKRLGPSAANIAFTGTDLCFGLFGDRLQNRVYSVPVTVNREWLFHNCVRNIKERGEYRLPRTDRIDFCRRGADSNAWLGNLAAEKTDFLVIARLHQNDFPHIDHDADGFPVELLWAQSQPRIFSLIYSNPQVKVFRLAPVASK